MPRFQIRSLRKTSATAKPLVLHIGTDKTGSTALQELLAGNAEALARHGLVYLKAGRNLRNNHTLLHEQTVAGDYSLWRRLAKELASSAMPCGLASFEGFYHLDEEQLRRIRKELPGVAVKIVIYLRRQSDIVRSGVAQRVKSAHLNLPLARYTTEHLMALGQNYGPVLARFGAVFGRDNLLVRRYERGRWPGQSIYLDFLSAIGIHLDGRQLQEQFRLPPVDSNPTLDVEALHLLDTLDSLGIEPARRVSVVRLLMAESGDNKSTFISDDAAAQVDAAFEQSNRAIAREWFGEETLFSEPSPFVFRAPDRDRLACYFNSVLRRMSLLEMPAWRGLRAPPHFLELHGKLRLAPGWASANKALRLGPPGAAMAFRANRPADAALLLELNGRWLGTPGRLSVAVNGTVLQDGDAASFTLRIPGWLHTRRARVVELQFDLAPVKAGEEPVFELDAMGYTAQQV